MYATAEKNGGGGVDEDPGDPNFDGAGASEASKFNFEGAEAPEASKRSHFEGAEATEASKRRVLRRPRPQEGRTLRPCLRGWPLGHKFMTGAGPSVINL